MPRFRDLCLPLAVALAAIAVSGHSAHAGLITTLEVTTEVVAGGLTEYDYTLSNLSASTINASFLFIAVDTTANLTALSGPTGWDISYATGDVAVGFTSPDASVDILPGSSGVFSFDSPLPPDLASYQVAGIDASGDFLTNDGVILSASVPEPASALPLAAGFLGMLIARRVSKRNRSPRAER